MSRTPFAGLEAVPPGGSLAADNYAFQSENPVITDQLLKVGAILHRHDAHAAQADPTESPTVSVLGSGTGTIPSDTTVYVSYTLNDPDGGESLPTGASMVTTPAGYADPSTAPTGVLSFTGGDLLANTLMYAITVTDGNGGETALGPPVTVVVTPSTLAEVQISGLAGITNASSDNSTTAGWRLWRSGDGGGTWYLMSTGAHTVDTWLDNGATAGDCSVSPPSAGTTGNSYSISVAVPNDAPAGATFANIYACTDGLFLSPCLLTTLALTGSAPATQTYTSLAGQTGSPPAASTCLPGANKLDPDTDLLYWHWKSPVATYSDLPSTGNADTDVRVATDSLDIYIWSATANIWTAWQPGDSTVSSAQEPGDYSLVESDMGTVIEMTSATASTLTVPDNAITFIPVGAVLEVCQYGTGAVTIAPQNGNVTLRMPAGYLASTEGQYASVGLRKRGPQEWILSGGLLAS